MEQRLHEMVRHVPLEGIVRIDAGMEGDWSGSVVTIWTTEAGFLGFDGVARLHPSHKPSLELYFDGAWVGVHCFRAQEGGNLFDEDAALSLLRYVEGRRASGNDASVR